VHANHFLRAYTRLGNVADGQRRRVRGKNAIGRNQLLNFLDNPVLQVDVLEDGLDHHVHLAEILEVQLRTQVAYNLVGFDPIG